MANLPNILVSKSPLRRFGKLLRNRITVPAIFLALLPAWALAGTATPTGDVPPPWAYPVDPPGVVAPKDDGTLRHVPNSTIAFTLTQVKDGFLSPDWHPNDHPALPEIVAHGRKPEVMACGYCHRAEGTGGPENASLAGLPAAYIIQQMADFKSGARKTSLPLRAPQKNMMALAPKTTSPEVDPAPRAPRWSSPPKSSSCPISTPTGRHFPLEVNCSAALGNAGLQACACDYNVIMKVDLVRIGNSRGIRIPKPLIEQCGLGDTVELSVEHGRIIVAPEDHPRRGWADAFRKAGDSATDELLLAGSPNQFDREEWEWQLPIPGLTKSGWWNSIPWLVRKYKKRGHAW